MESSHRGLRRRVAALALEVDVSKSETQGKLSGCGGAIRSHLVFSLPELAGQAPSEGKQANPVESFFLLSATIHVILNSVVVTVLVTCTGNLSSNP